MSCNAKRHHSGTCQEHTPNSRWPQTYQNFEWKIIFMEDCLKHVLTILPSGLLGIYPYVKLDLSREQPTCTTALWPVQIDEAEWPLKTSIEKGYKKELNEAHCFCQGHCSLWCTVSISFFRIIYSCVPLVNIMTQKPRLALLPCFHSLIEISKVSLAQH